MTPSEALVSCMHPFYGYLLLLIIAVVFLQRKCWRFIWQLNGWRGIIQQPLLWLLLMCYLDPKSIMTSIQRFRKYFQFPLAIILFNRILLYADDPVTMEGILTAPACLNKTFMQNGFYANKGLLHAKDEKWKIRRKQLNPAFSHNTLVRLLGDFNHVAQALASKLTAVVQGKSKMAFDDMEDLVSRAVLEVSCLTIMGVAINFTQHDGKGIASAYRYLMETTALRILRPWYQFDFLFRLLERRKFEKAKKAYNLVEDFVTKIVQQKHIEWQQRQQLQRDKSVNGTSDVANATSAAAIGPERSLRCTGHGCEAERSILHENMANVNGTHKVATIADDASRIGSVAEHRIFIDQIFHLAELGKLTLGDVMNEAQSMMVVSFETVSTCVINALLCLATNHDWQDKLRREITRQLSKHAEMSLLHFPQDGGGGDIADNAAATNTHAIRDNDKCRSSATNDAENVTMGDLQHMPYLDMILNESLRLLSTVPINLRNVSAEFQLNVIAAHQSQQQQRDPTTASSANNPAIYNIESCRADRRPSEHRPCATINMARRVVTVPKGTMIALDMFNMHRSKDYWGTNALAFYPEHFAKERQPQDSAQVETRHSFAYIPFSKGLRTCIGHRYSIYLSKIMLCKLISSFDFTTNIRLQELQACEGVSLKYRNSKDIHFTVRQVSAE